MLQWIRWWGLGVFVALVAGVTAFMMLAAPYLVKSSIESLGSKAAGAKVEVDSVGLSLAPLGLSLQGFRVANADKPMENLVEFERAVADLELGPLFLGKGIIQDLSIDALQFNTPRTVSGALESASSSSGSGSGFDSGRDGDGKSAEKAPSALDKLPSAEELLAREKLKTEAAGKAFQQTYKTRKVELDDALEQVPSEQDLKQYEDDVRAIVSGDLKSLEDFQQRKAKLDALKKQFEKDRKALKHARTVIGETRSEVGQRLKDLKAAPGEDLANLKQKYQLNATGAANLSQLLFGPEVGEWAHQALYWYEMIKPYLNSGSESAPVEAEPERPKGRFVHFPTSDPWPEFLVRHTGISAITPRGNLAIQGRDLTHQQAVLGRPSRVDVNGDELDRIKALKANLTLDHRVAPGRDTATLDVQDWQVDSADLGVGGTQLEAAQAQLQGMAQVSGDQLISKMDAQFGQAQFSGDGQTVFAKELLLALKTIDQFTVHAEANGDVLTPAVELGSDLDRRLNAAFGKRLKQQQDKLEARLKSKLNARIDEFAGPYASELKALNNTDASLNERFDQLQALASEKLEDFAAQQKRKAEEKAKAKADEEKQRLKDKAEDELKNSLKKLF
jgi:uncharacterized protein (TIGR03545 family)